MNLLPFLYSPQATDDSESDMQRSIALIMEQCEFGGINPSVYREVGIPKINRISDVIVKVTGRQIVNIECKLTDHSSVLAQAKDHLKWADYSYICLHAFAPTPNYFIQKIIDLGIGLLLWAPQLTIEVIPAYHNTIKKGKDMKLHDRVNKKLLELDQLKTGQSENQNQLSISHILINPTD